ncbi:MAG TPA: DUF5665 domain-containing protein [Patescibacteria group bacterium]|nr:DUF5665 domain-containing protein [Patescibacteria group bacterium]
MAKNNPQNFEQASFRYTLKQIIRNNFIGGIFWALGATVGISLVIALLTLLSHYVNFIPFIGGFAAEVTKFVIKNNSNIR